MKLLIFYKHFFINFTIVKGRADQTEHSDTLGCIVHVQYVQQNAHIHATHLNVFLYNSSSKDIQSTSQH